MISEEFHVIRFRIGDYTDALSYSLDEWEEKPDWESAAKERYAKWQAAVEESAKAPEPDKATVLADIDAQIAALDEQRKAYG